MAKDWTQFRPFCESILGVLLLEQHVVWKASGQPASEMEGAKGFQETIARLSSSQRHELIHRLITAALGLDEDVCQSHGLQIMIAADIPPHSSERVGLCRNDFDLGQAKQMAAHGELLTVRLAPERDDSEADWLENADGSVLYEVEKLQQRMHGRPAYRVVGVWIPAIRTSSSLIGAVVDMAAGTKNAEMADAFIV